MKIDDQIEVQEQQVGRLRPPERFPDGESSPEAEALTDYQAAIAAMKPDNRRFLEGMLHKDH